MTLSNEHPDMSGNFADYPYYCSHCGKEVKEDKVLQMQGDDEHFFCSNICCEEWDESQRDMHP